MKQLSIDFGNILRKTAGNQCKPVYRHSPYDRRGRGRTKKGRRGPALRTVFWCCCCCFTLFLLFANGPPFPHLSDNVNRQYTTSFLLNPLSFFFFPPLPVFSTPFTQAKYCKATATVLFRYLRSFQVYIGIFPCWHDYWPAIQFQLHIQKNILQYLSSPLNYTL